MIAIRLAARDGGHVCDVIIPPFQKLPEVLVWGERFFTFHTKLDDPEELCVAEYREAFAYCVPPIDYEPDGGAEPAKM